MVRSAALDRKLRDLVRKYGDDRVAQQLARVRQSSKRSATSTLTIISSSGLHPIPRRYLRGAVFEVTRKSLQMRDSVALRRNLRTLLKGLAGVLRSRTWKKIY